MSEPTVAVAVATTGARPDSVLRCLEAVLRGTRAPERLLVVDQGAGDALERALASLRTERGTLLERMPQDRRGLSASRNLALEHTSEEIVAVTDDDCVPSADWVQALVAAFGDASSPAIVTGPVLALAAVGERSEAVSSRTRTTACTFHRRVAPWHVGTGGNMAFRRELLGALRFDERLGAGSAGRAGEDIDLIARALAAGLPIRFDPAAVVRHERQTPSRRSESRFDYGFGVGAALGLAIGWRDPRAGVDLASWLLLRGRLAVRRRRIGEELRMLHGTLAGLSYGVRL
jgi:GT2 family glycosyltransferase